MRPIASGLLLVVTGALVTGCGADHRPHDAVGIDGVGAPVALAQGLSLPAGHPLLHDGPAAHPDGHLPLVDGGAALPEGHPRCPRGMLVPQEAPQLDFNIRSGSDDLVST